MFKKSLSLISVVFLLSISAFSALAIDTSLPKATPYHSDITQTVDGLQADISALDEIASITDIDTEVTGSVAALQPEPGEPLHQSNATGNTPYMADSSVAGSMTDNLRAEALGGEALLAASNPGPRIF